MPVGLNRLTNRQIVRNSSPMAASKRRYTIKDIAEQSDVSLSTVSLVLNNNPRISEATRKRVHATMQRLGYEPNRMARALAWKHTRTLAVMLPQLRHTLADVYFGDRKSTRLNSSHRT